jgi:ABC-2 type transport system ATP-binding protein
VITTRGLTKHFGSALAISDLNLHVPAGSVFALLGPNGAGKTTAIRTILNIIRATGGDAEVLGVDSRKLAPTQLARIGYVSENRELPEWMRVGPFLNYCRAFYPAWNDEEAAGLIRMLQLPLDRTLRSLSRGIRMKVALTSALSYRPDLLILDEPFSGLDVVVREQLVQSIAERTPECTVLLATHDLTDIETFATHVAYLSDGRLLFAEEMDDLAARFREVEVLTESPGHALQTLERVPDGWMNLTQSSGVVRFTHAHYDAGRCESEVRASWPGIRELSVRAVPLRSIFITLASQRAPGR